MKQYKHLGSYGLLIKEDNIVLVDKVGGPYDGLLDLPGGTIEFGETPKDALIRELYEEVGIKVVDFKLFDGNSVKVRWNHKDEIEEVHHIGFFYKINSFEGNIKSSILIDSTNDDSKGAKFYNIKELKKNKLSEIAKLELEKLGYKLK